MHISKVQIYNVRGFGEGELAVDLDLKRPDGSYAGWTVIAGRNGSGKSTFLKAIALSIAGPAMSRSLEDSFSGWINTRSESAGVATHLRFSPRDDHFQGPGRPPRGGIWTGLSWEDLFPTGPEPKLRHYFVNGGNLQSRERGPWAENPGGWLVVGYGPFRRVTGETPTAQRLMVGPHRLSSLVTLFREDASLGECVKWLKDIHMRAIEKKEGFKELEEGIMALLNDGLLPDGLEATRVDSDGLWVRQHGTELSLDLVSDGYRTATALVVDIARQMFACYRRFEVERTDEGRCVVRRSGVVLIDEIDVHLHVSWQQRIGFWLKSHFPEVQFIVSTHSPFICQAADPRGLIRLPAPGEEQAAQHVSKDIFRRVVNGSADDAVLSALFGLERPWSETSEALRSEWNTLRAKDLRGDISSESEKKRLRQIPKELPVNPSDEVARAVSRLQEWLDAPQDRDPRRR